MWEVCGMVRCRYFTGKKRFLFVLFYVELCRANPRSDVVLVPGSACRAFVSCENSTSLGQSRCLGGTSYSFDTSQCEFDAPCDDPSARGKIMHLLI